MLGTTLSMHTGVLAVLDAWTFLHMYVGNILCITAPQERAAARLHAAPDGYFSSACVEQS